MGRDEVGKWVGVSRALRGGACACVLAVLLIWIQLGAAPLRMERRGEAARAGPVELSALLASSWADVPARIAARSILLDDLSGSSAEAESLLEHSLRARPLYAPTWLARAELALRRKQPERARIYASLAMGLWPARERLLWRVAMLRTDMGDRDGAFHALRAYLHATHDGVRRTLWVAQRLEPDPELLVAELVPLEELRRSEADARLRRLLYQAFRQQHVALADAVWSRLSESARQERATLGRYVDVLVGAGLADRATALWWRDESGHSSRRGITNPGFEQAAAQGGLGWRVQAAPGVRSARDRSVRYRGSYSLCISFDGRRNLSYRHAWQLVPVEPDQAYRLMGFWRGEDVTTRSGPYLEVRSRAGDPPLRARNRSAVGSWGWERFELEFRVPPHARFVEIRVRRDRTAGSDLPVAGSVWIDELVLEPMRGELRG